MQVGARQAGSAISSSSWRAGRGLPRPVDRSAALVIAFRVVVVAAQAATLWITWPLWTVHASPPMLPALPLPALDLGWLLLVCLGLVLATPRFGLGLYTAVLAYAVLIDQTRLQPEVVSLTFLMWGTLSSHTAKTLARAHLVALWVFSGLNKLFSPDFMDGMSQWLLSGLMPSPPSWLNERAGYVIAVPELSVGLLALYPRTRRFAAVAACALHIGIFLDLSPVGHDWNAAVWPWNLALAVAGFALIAPWVGSPLSALGRCPPLVRPLVALLVVSPLGFYVGVTDAYVAHNLYSANTARATVRCVGECRPEQQPTFTWEAFDVPLPPEHRLFEQHFERTCEPGDRLTIRDSRWWYRVRDLDHRTLTCPASGVGHRGRPAAATT